MAVAYIGFTSRPAGAPPTFTTGTLPLVGTFLEFTRNPIALVAKGFESKGPVYTVNIFGQNLTFLLGAPAHDRFFSTDDRFLSQSEVYKFMTPVFGKGIVYDAPPKMMSKQLAFIKNALRGDALHSYVPIIVREAEDYFRDHWKDGEVVDLHESMARLIILTASSCLMGPEVRGELFEDVARIFRELDEGITPLSFFWPTAPTHAHACRDRARAELGRIFAKLVRKRRADPDASTTYSDVLQVFVDSKYADGSSTTEDQVCGLMVALLFAGQHTSSITTTWLTLLLHHNPSVLVRARAEVDAAFASADADDVKPTARSGPGALGFAKVDSMELMSNCVTETLRMYPPLVLLMRKVMGNPLRVGKYSVPVGDIVVASPQVSHRLPEGPHQAFTNPGSFDPDRFNDERAEHRRVPSGFAEMAAAASADGKAPAAPAPKNFVGFGGGYHNCRGEQFARVQAKAIVSVMLRDWIIEPQGAMPEADFAAIVVGPKSGVPVRVRRRTK